MTTALAMHCERGLAYPRAVQYPNGAVDAAMSVAWLWYWPLTPSHALHSIRELTCMT
jgi:hypothetical protein